MLLQSAPPVAAGAAWALVGTCATAGGSTGSWDFLSNVTDVDFTSLVSNELMIIARGLVAANSGLRQLLLSTDNGSSYRGTSGDYIGIASAGTESNFTTLPFHTTANAAARSGVLVISNAGISGVSKLITSTNGGFSTALFIQSTSPINAIRINNSAGGNLTAGSIRVMGR